MSELSDIVRTTASVIAASHTAATLGRAYTRHLATKEYYFHESFIQRLPRCAYKRVLKPKTFLYTAAISAFAMLAYQFLQNI